MNKEKKKSRKSISKTGNVSFSCSMPEAVLEAIDKRRTELTKADGIPRTRSGYLLSLAAIDINY